MPDLHDFECPKCEFVSTGHATKKSRDERGKQHATEHETGQPMPELADFLKEN